MKKTKWPGNWKVTCHVCGMWYPSSEIRKRWDGLLVCDKDFETRHPQTLIKLRTEKIAAPFISKDASPDSFVLLCTLEGRSGFADLGTADCAQADKNDPSYLFLQDI